MKILVNLFCTLSLLTLPLIAQAAAPHEKQSIVFGVHSKTAPLEWRNNGVEQGFNLELMDRIGQLIGKRIVVRRKTFQQLLADVHNPESLIDVIAVVSPVTIDRDLSQSDPIYATHAKAYTLQGKSFIDGWNDLKGKRVAIKKGACVDVYISGKLQNFKRVDVDLYETGFQLLIKGKVDVVIAENFVARRLMPLYPSIRSSSDPLIYGAFNFISNHKNAVLMDKINDALRQLKLSGEYDRLVNKWFGTGREKVDLNSAQQKILSLAIFVSLISAIGMLLTGYISLNLRRRTTALNLELAQRKKAETAISNLSKQFQSVLDGIPHGVTLFNREGECLWSNDNNQLLSNPLFHYEDGQPFTLYPTLIEALDTDKSTIADMMIENQYWQLQLHPIGDNQAVILLEETTEQQRLRQANNEASRLASLGELSAGIAHEINNPTGIIVHSIAFINDALTDLSSAADSYQKQNPFWNIAGLEPTSAMAELSLSSQSILEGAGRISRIVSDLKRYALPTLTDAYQAIALNEVVLVSLRLTANQIKLLNVATELHNPSPIIKGDAQQLNQVLINLIQNACHAIELDAETYEHDQHILIKTSVEEQFACLTVIDKGQGMDRATLQRITEPFFTTRRSNGGSGLGLSVCSRIIKEHKADMQIESRIGQGTVITLRFPLESQT
ncbi:sensor histidine kinase [Shewanella sp. Choline-02u-19]|jgi:signal transduction histidine kinase/ABC-type amino acid transport substrate-binding protein|uniref:ATP-binding protein n=1 Tax=unclassified Shewanella TaxID=196818 RepID=UPI000C34DD0E|nr:MULTISPECIES: transporter substrate-binding domain-containing protein [unclassified Shewanella]PKG55988.1 sensor histidine kinase [Shewanella sp. GutDb-MelDb]PKG74103.1 sensor histidine kinase [Shewanella sp. GutCb]PKH56442.1 sensor histidine kinase [Shewanella sp. Bg11-22]PKI30003.1 sensor histidine kinase [Shewanella sp. Choline-02u-19]